jgi:predicted permease
LNELLTLFLENIFPIIIVAGLGFFLQRIFRLDPAPFSTIVFYALTPSLIFKLLLESHFSGSDILRISGLAAAVVVILLLLGLGISRVFKLSPVRTAAFILTVAFMNSGNYGLSLNSYALGQIGLAWASVYFVTSSTLTNSLGVFIASTGRSDLINALKSMLRVPAIYAIFFVLFIRVLNLPLPNVVMKPIDALSYATIPTMLLVLGMQISRAGLPSNLKLVGLAAFLRLVISPLIAWPMTRLLGLSSIGTQAGILESSMPSAVLAIIISTEFETEPDFVSAVVLITTLLSPFTLTPIMSLIGL